jgi:hypothetical protein
MMKRILTRANIMRLKSILKKVFLALAFLLGSNISGAQTNDGIKDSVQLARSKNREFVNSIIFSGTDYAFPGTFRRLGTLLFWKDDQIAIYYERKVRKHFNIKIGYNEWNTFSWYHGNNPPYNTGFVLIPERDTLRVGSILTCNKYKMLEEYTSYMVDITKRHKINVGVGISYTWGLNERLDSITVVPGAADYLLTTSLVKAHYWGIVPSIGYDYICLKNRLRLGIDVRYREYFNFYLKTAEYGFHVGFNF